METLQALLQVFQGEILVVDDGSMDNTASLCGDLGVGLLEKPKQKGKAEAIYDGVLHTQEDPLLFLDADLGSTAAHALDLLEYVENGLYDMVLARLKEGPGGVGFLRKVSRWYLKVVDLPVLEQPLSGQRCLRRNVFWQCWGDFTGFGLEMGLNIMALRKGYRVLEHPLPLTHRQRGRGYRDFCHRGRQAYDIAKTIWELH